MSIRIRQYNRKLRYSFLGALVALLGASGLLTLTNRTVAAEESAARQSSASRIVTIYDSGQRQSAMTKAVTVRQALKEAKVTFDEQRDVVEPALDTKISNNDFQINLYRARVVTIVEKSHRVRITTTAQSPAQIAQAAGVALYREDEVQFSPPDDIALDGASILMKITRAPQRTVTAEEEIDFPVEQERDASKPIGYREVKQAGEKGLRKLTYQIDALDGVETARRQVANEIIKQPKKQIEIVGGKPSNPLTKAKGAHIFTDSKGVAHRETYYDLPMNVVIKACGGGGDYTVREDGAKVDKDGYILVAANYGNYPRCSVVETSMGLGKVYDTGGFAARHPHGFDLATDWTNGKWALEVAAHESPRRTRRQAPRLRADGSSKPSRGPKKELGQHWLKDPEVLANIAAAAELEKDDFVLEIGPGLGTLTSRLLARAGSVTAVEFDADLARKLPGQFPGKNLTVVNEDILQFDLGQLPAGYKVVANVPYYITSKIVEKLMTAENKPALAVLLVQKEVAERIAALPGEMSILALSAQIYTQATLDIEVPRQFFTPPPKVDSQVVVLRTRQQPLVAKEDEKRFFRVVKAGFSSKRKKLRSSIAAGLALDKLTAENLLQKAGINPEFRAEDLSIDQWLALTKVCKRDIMKR